MDLKNATIITAMVTPFDEYGNIDFKLLPKLVEHLLANHTEALILAGTTGESPTLTHDEEIKLFHEVIRIVDGRVPIICGVGTNDTRDSIEFIKEISAIKGIDAGLAVVPYYNKPSQEGLYRHFKALAESSDLPIILYNVPSRTITKLEPETSLRLAKIENIIAIKECSGLEVVAELVERAPKDFLVYTGDDPEAFSVKAFGGQGVISVTSHLFGNEIYDMFEAIDNGKIKKAAGIHRKLLPKTQALFNVAPSPAPVKAALNACGISVGGLRLPLVECTPEEKEKILSILDL